jgi:hypothetical protein
MLRYESFELVKSWYDNFRYNQSKCATVKDKSFTKLNKPLLHACSFCVCWFRQALIGGTGLATDTASLFLPKKNNGSPITSKQSGGSRRQWMQGGRRGDQHPPILFSNLKSPISSSNGLAPNYPSNLQLVVFYSWNNQNRGNDYQVKEDGSNRRWCNDEEDRREDSEIRISHGSRRWGQSANTEKREHPFHRVNIHYSLPLSTFIGRLCLHSWF